MGYFDNGANVIKVLVVAVAVSIGIASIVIFSEATLPAAKIEEMVVDGMNQKAELEKSMIRSSNYP